MWFSANLLFKARYPNCPENEFLWESSIVLIESPTEEGVNQIAQNIGSDAQHEYISANGDVVRWTFERIERIYEIEAERLQSGVEVFSCFLRDSEVKSLLTPFDD